MRMNIRRGVNSNGQEITLVTRGKEYAVQPLKKEFELYTVPVPNCVLWQVDFDTDSRGRPCFCFEGDSMKGYRPLINGKTKQGFRSFHQVIGSLDSYENIKYFIALALKARDFKGVQRF